MKISKEITIFIVFLTLVVLLGLFTNPLSDIRTPANNELKVGGMNIRFEDGTSESEVKAVLENYKNYNMNTNYSIDCNAGSVGNKYYIMVDKDNRDIRRELRKGMEEENKDWIISSSATGIRKGDSYVIAVSEQAVNDEKFLSILNKYDTQVKKFIWCYIRFEKPDGSKYWIPEENAIRIKNELENNESIFTVSIDYIYDQ
ncbi:hypothetical protein EO95_15450 [Methanosarcina sp. 1.H.T.1A.1]|uniref:UPF0228 family protein n=1 Tax=Methanosarcina sp. 1.H.T.1A.1 TaxID=1483602 RepID=UPI0006229CB0|nr:UPF0228 family protein [Methanosarcina sp. 1.H.T.1A.1]KKH91995.1 hypothetical protein EO95_15450 [Methanosarcina sp. 1.H.T.1A.1]